MKSKLDYPKWVSTELTLSLSQLIFKFNKCWLNLLYAQILWQVAYVLYRSMRFKFYFKGLIVPWSTGAILPSLLENPWDNFLYNTLTLTQAEKAPLWWETAFPKEQKPSILTVSPGIRNGLWLMKWHSWSNASHAEEQVTWSNVLGDQREKQPPERWAEWFKGLHLFEKKEWQYGLGFLPYNMYICMSADTHTCIYVSIVFI